MTDSFTDDMLAMVDQKIAESKERVTYPGTMSTVGVEPTVILDGSGVAIPCKLTANLDVHEGDRVVSLIVGSDLVVIRRFGVDTPTIPLPTEFAVSEGTGISNYGNSVFARATVQDAAEGTFNAPLSGNIMIRITCNQMYMGAATILGRLGFEVKTGATVNSGTIVANAIASINRALAHQGTDPKSGHMDYYLTGLTPGSPYNIYLVGRCPSNVLYVLGTRILIEYK